jgi:hypothetical protein
MTKIETAVVHQLPSLKKSDLLIYEFLKDKQMELCDASPCLAYGNDDKAIESMIDDEIIDEQIFVTKKESIENFLTWLDDNIEEFSSKSGGDRRSDLKSHGDFLSKKPNAFESSVSTENLNSTLKTDEERNSASFTLYDRLSNIKINMAPVAKDFCNRVKSKMRQGQDAFLRFPRSNNPFDCAYAMLSSYCSSNGQHPFYANFKGDLRFKEVLNNNLRRFTANCWQSFKR